MASETAGKIYIVTAYRWGWTNNSCYTVIVTTNEHHAISAAEAECSSRGGKYGCDVLAHLDGKDDEPKRVAYFPSSYGEKEPHTNWRIKAAHSIGIEVLVAMEDGTALLPKEGEPGRLESKTVELPEWLVEKVNRESEMAKIICGK